MYDLTESNKYKFYIGGVKMKVHHIELVERKPIENIQVYSEMIIYFYSPYGQCEMKVQYTDYIIVEKQDKIVIKTVQGKLLELYYD